MEVESNSLSESCTRLLFSCTSSHNICLINPSKSRDKKYTVYTINITVSYKTRPIGRKGEGVGCRCQWPVIDSNSDHWSWEVTVIIFHSTKCFEIEALAWQLIGLKCSVHLYFTWELTWPLICKELTGEGPHFPCPGSPDNVKYCHISFTSSYWSIVDKLSPGFFTTAKIII